MSRVNLKRLSTNDLVLLFEKLCVEQYDSLDRQEYAAFNRRYDRIQAIEDELKSRPGDQRRILMTLFGQHASATHCGAGHPCRRLSRSPS